MTTLPQPFGALLSMREADEQLGVDPRSFDVAPSPPAPPPAPFIIEEPDWEAEARERAERERDERVREARATLAEQVPAEQAEVLPAPRPTLPAPKRRSRWHSGQLWGAS